MKTKFFSIILFSLTFILITNAQTAQKQTKSGSNVKIMHDKERQFYYIADSENGKLIKLLSYNLVSDFSEGMALVQSNKIIGFINEKGEEIVPLDGKYQWGRDFSEGMAVVGTTNEKGLINAAGFINKSGELVIPMIFQEAKSFVENLAPVKKDDKWGFIDKNGKIVIPCTYSDAYLFNDGLAVVVAEEQKDGKTIKKYGCIDKKGNITIPLEYKFVSGFYKTSTSSYSLTKDDNDKYQLIDKKGKVVTDFAYSFDNQDKKTPIRAEWLNGNDIKLSYHLKSSLHTENGVYNANNNSFRVKPEYDDLLEIKDNNYIVLNSSNLRGVCNITEKVPAAYNFIFDQDNLYYAILGGKQTKTGIDGGKYVLYDYSGKKLTKYDDKDSYDEIIPFYEGMARVKRNGKYGYIDNKGNEIIPLEYEYAGVFSSGVATVSTGGEKAGAINKKNQVVIPFKYDDLGNFVDGISFYKQDSLYGLINNKGEIITKPIFKGIGNFSEGLAPFMKDGKIGYLNTKGEIVIPAEYETGNPFSEGYAMVSKDKKAGYIDEKGTLIIPLKYDNGREFKDGYTLVIEGNKYFLLDKKGNIVKTY